MKDPMRLALQIVIGLVALYLLLTALAYFAPAVGGVADSLRGKMH